MTVYKSTGLESSQSNVPQIEVQLHIDDFALERWFTEAGIYIPAWRWAEMRHGLGEQDELISSLKSLGFDFGGVSCP